MSKPQSGHSGEDDEDQDASEAVSPEETLEALPTEEELEAEFDG